jgi:hypothetical protein
MSQASKLVVATVLVAAVLVVLQVANFALLG